MGIASHIHVEVVAEEITFPVGIPSPVTIRLGIQTFACTGSHCIFPAFADTFFPLLCRSADRGAITGKGKVFRVYKSLFYGFLKELCMVHLENKPERVLWFQVPAFQQRKQLRSHAGRITRSLVPFLLLPFGGFILGKRSFGERLSEPLCHIREKKS